MKTGIRGIALAMMLVIVLMTVMAVTGRMNRSMEVRSNLSSVVEETVENMAVETYEIADVQEYVADFTEALSDSLDTDARVIVTVSAADKEKGILNLSVKEEFLHPNGRQGSVSCERAVILNGLAEEEEQRFSVCFYAAREEVGMPGACYKEYAVSKGETVLAPDAPARADGTFAGWCDADGNPADFSVPLEQDVVYYAAWN